MKKEEYQKIFEIEENHWWYQGMKQISVGLLGTVVKPSKNLKILDAGCGCGEMLVCLERIGNAYGIDISQEALKFCLKRGLKMVKLASIEKIPFKDKTFDLVTCFDVLYHQWVKNDLVALKEFNRVLKPKRYLLLRVPAYNWLRGSHDKIVSTKHRYSRKEIAQKLKIANFTILRLTYANTILFPFAVSKRILERFLPKSQLSDVKPTPKILNRILMNILALESLIISKTNLPFGLSLFCLAQKNR